MPAFSEIEENLVRVVGLQLRNFRGFSFMDLELEQEKPVNVFIADNGGGKTTILDAIARFLLDFLNQTILNQNKFLPQKHQKNWNSKDIKNDQEVAYCSAKLELTYFQPALELLEVIAEMTDFLNEYELEGKVAWLELHRSESNVEGDYWSLVIEETEEGNDEDTKNLIPLPADILDRLDQLAMPGTTKVNNWEEVKESRKLVPDDTFIVATRRTDEGWMGNICFDGDGQRVLKVKYSGALELEVEINKAGVPIIARPVIPKKGLEKALETYITYIREGVAFLEDFRSSVKYYNSEYTTVTLPLLVYYGGSAINTQFGEVGIQYTAELYQSYIKALQPSRFDFEEFFEWLNWVKSNEPSYIFDRVEKTVLTALNADEDTYKELKIEKGQLWLDKAYVKGQGALPVEVSQLSAGEKNMLALVGDLTKRAIQLNPVLFEIDYDEEQGTFSNPLEYTQGVVLIDEVDLHFHPKWQRQVLPTLRRLFPKIQFLVTTHSPFVLQTVPPSQRLRITNGTMRYFSGEAISDYEGIVIDYFKIGDFFDPETEEKLKRFRFYAGEIHNGERARNDLEFRTLVFNLTKKGDLIKSVVAYELNQLEKQLGFDND
ncbi:MAG: AAA family ATPase [bacterium]|nr:AAA family ATPase [bacterium]